ncbi:CKLF-like MARVEL transmembrane domain-containing protein 7 isoform X2 [Brienomyrus brachyistius]|uniref:CKLF-like MARVEL transmembrane domain-containing protein 7 isoform X2 n=1 Tax=Brienomyrus brachyistius TaxID=42636 RepID=UPI0020B3732A|nr:CKLF-like MARVEL transmembrane domain-containing protein 7 isoform X2 [Brienomyrus brachyistius]
MSDSTRSSRVMSPPSPEPGNVRGSAQLYDWRFTRTAPGRLTVAEIVFGLLVWMLIAGTDYSSVPALGWLMFIAVVCWLLTVFFFIVYLTSAYSRIPLLPWRTVLSLLIAFLCVYCELRWYGPSGFLYFQVVTLWFHIAFLIFLIMHVFDLQTKMPCINWTITEFLHYVLGFFLVFIASIVVGVQSHGYSSFVAGSVFGFIAAFLLVLSLWLSYRVTFGRQQMTVGV